VFLAYKGTSSCIRYGHERVFLIGFLGYLSIGVGSMCFHSSLKCMHNYSPLNDKANLATDPMQLLDELSMIYTTCIMVYALFSYRQSTRTCIAIFIAILSLAMFITGYYHYVQDPKFHQNMFALLTVIVVFRTIYMMEFLLRPSRRAKRADVKLVNNSEYARANRRDEDILKTMWAMIACGLSAMAIGFLIWKLDTIFCGTLRRWRRDVGLPWGILLEGHGWW
jgi:dihydroceramidase